MMISLHPEVIVKCHSLINLGAFLCIFSIHEFKRVSDVVDNLNNNNLFASDLQDLQLLCSILLQNSDLSDPLKQDIDDVHHYLELKIIEFGTIKKSCGRQMITLPQ